MARKAAAESESAHGFNDIIGVVLLAAALLLLVAQLSFDPHDLASIRNPPNKPTHNWIGPLGAHLAGAVFFVGGFSGYMLPVVLTLFGLAYLFEGLFYLKRRWIWALALLLSCMGWLHLLDLPHGSDPASLFSKARNSIGAPSIGGFVGLTLYRSFFWMFGTTGAGIVYGAVDLISLLFLTNFQLGAWLRETWGARKQAGEQPSEDEQVLERQARELKKQAQKLQEEVDRSGLGAD